MWARRVRELAERTYDSSGVGAGAGCLLQTLNPPGSDNPIEHPRFSRRTPASIWSCLSPDLRFIICAMSSKLLQLELTLLNPLLV